MVNDKGQVAMARLTKKEAIAIVVEKECNRRKRKSGLPTYKGAQTQELILVSIVLSKEGEYYRDSDNGVMNIV